MQLVKPPQKGISDIYFSIPDNTKAGTNHLKTACRKPYLLLPEVA